MFENADYFSSMLLLLLLDATGRPLFSQCAPPTGHKSEHLAHRKANGEME